MTLKLVQLPEPLIRFAHGQQVEAPKDGLFLFGPFEDAQGRSEVRVGVIGTKAGVGLSRRWFTRLQGFIPGKRDKKGSPLVWAPPWPGFEACFGLSLPTKGLAEIQIPANKIDAAIKISNRADAVRSTVLLFADAIRRYRQREERQPDVWMVVVPDVVYRYGRPKVSAPPREERTPSTIPSRKAAERFFEGGDLFPETMKDAEIYLYGSNFHHQLKAELLEDKVALQLILESTLHDRSISLSVKPKGLQDEATVAWNFSTTLYFKMDAKPWALANVRPGVCYVGLVFKKDDTPGARGEACCAAQMFMNSGDGLVFRGALGPWYSEKSREYHLSEGAANDLMKSVVDGYSEIHGEPPSELFIHGRSRFNDEEWDGFSAAVPTETLLAGVRIRPLDEMRLFRPNASTPVLRGTAILADDWTGLLWTRGFVGRLSAYQGFETPKALTIEISHGEADLEQVMADVLALTKVNYNACDFASGLPVTLKFANRVGEILMASPKTKQAPPLPFRYYI